MALKRQISANRFITLESWLAENYVEQPDGTYKLDLVEADGTPSPPPPKPEEVAALKSAHEKTKREVRELKEQIAAERASAKAGDDAAIIAERQKRIAEIEDRIAETERAGKAALAALAAEYEPKIAERHAKHQAVLAEGDELVLDHTLEKTIHAAGGIATFLLPKLKKFCRVVRDEDDAIGKSRRVAIFDDLGTLRVNADGQPVTPAQALEELRVFDPMLAKTCFEPSGGNGNGPH
jgi:hypothetical protein